MNRLKNTLCYLCGAMDRVADGGVGWREYISTEIKKMGVGVLNPCDKPTTFGLEDENFREIISKLKKQKNFDKIRTEMKPITAIDLRMVDICHFLVMHLDIDVHMCGSYHEAFLATGQKKPVLIVCEQGKAQAPNWLFGIIPHEHIFSNWTELLKYLRHIDGDESVSHLNRWRFFDWERVYG